VADIFYNRILKFDSNGKFLTKWGSFGDDRSPFGVAVDSEGSVYVADTSNHCIQKFTNHVPVADAGSDQTVPAGTAVTLDGSNSSDLHSDIISYVWTFDDGGSATGQVFIKGFTTEGTYTATLTLTDSLGQSDSDIINITVTPEEPPLETPMEATEHLIEEIQALDLPKRTENRIIANLDNVLRCLEHANAKLAAVSAELEEQDADDLVGKVQMIIDAITSGDFEGWK
jgi:PKD repeat protein